MRKILILKIVYDNNDRTKFFIDDELQFDGYGLQPATILNMISMAAGQEYCKLHIDEEFTLDMDEWEAEQNETTKRIDTSAIETVTIGEPKDDESSSSS